MGAADEQELQRRDSNRANGRKRGSVDNASRLAAFAGRSGGSSADWGACDPGWIQAVVVGITRLGGAVTFGTSRDGGAHSLTLLLDGERQTLWFNGGADLDTELETVYQTLEALH